MNPLIVVMLGVTAGLMPGFFGFGGGWLLVPLLVGFGMGWSHASGTALCAIMAGACSGVARQMLKGDCEIEAPGARTVPVVLVVSALLGTAVGKVLVRDSLAGFEFATVVLDGVLASVLLVVACLLLREVLKQSRQSAPAQPGGAALAVISMVAVITGMVSGLTGIGGGIFYVPLLLLLLRWSEDDARAVGRMASLASAIVGAGLYGYGGGVHLPTAVCMFVPAGIAGVATSAFRFNRSPGRRKAFKLSAIGLALLALVLTLLHMTDGRSCAPAGEPGNELGVAALAVTLPLGWGIVCALVATRIIPSFYRK